MSPFNRTSMESKLRGWIVLRESLFLLIEPVWNRNPVASWFSPLASVSFNRTSMESKPGIYVRIALINWKPFNRTSMESKPNALKGNWSRRLLLIEPVWNRNSNELKIAEAVIASLLIEPVWNRNFCENELLEEDDWLLIEPVWNRNVVESNRWDYNDELLIEPVWNRNILVNVGSDRGLLCF